MLWHEERATLWLIRVLRSVGEQGAQAIFNKRRDVDGEGRPNIGVERGVEDLVRDDAAACRRGVTDA